MATISHTHIDLPGAEGHRFRLFEAKASRKAQPHAVVALERHAIGPVWAPVDSRSNRGYSDLDPEARDAWARQAEAELLEHWFSLEIARARD